MPFVYSTLSTDTTYNFYQPRVGKTTTSAVLIPYKKILIKGNANIADKSFRTSKGTVTEVTQEEAELLMTHNVFLMHEKNKFVCIEDRKEKLSTVIENTLDPREPAAPKIASDFPKKDPDDELATAPQPTTNKKKK